MKGDRVYVTWYDVRQIDESYENRFLSFARSTNGGSSFELPVSVADNSTDSVFKVNGGVIVNDNGYIFAAWNDCRIDPFFCERQLAYCSRAVEKVGTDEREPFTPGPKSLQLFQNYPNPFNPTTTISFIIHETAGTKQPVELTIYDLRGKFVKTLIDSELLAGNHTVTWDGRNDRGDPVSSGIYFEVVEKVALVGGG